METSPPTWSTMIMMKAILRTGDDDLEDHHVKADPEKPNKPANNNFVNKLHTMISDPKAASFIWWTELGTR
jgi:hypothetical protein